jgi:leucine dehydrogenase
VGVAAHFLRVSRAGAAPPPTPRGGWGPARPRRRAGGGADELGARIVGPDEIFTADVDVFAPCALGAVLNDRTVPLLRARIVTGAANNQLATPADGQALFERGVAYAPDYVVNAGGLIQIALSDQSDDLIADRVGGIYDTVTEVFERAASAPCPPAVMADRMAEAVLAGEGSLDAR